jgi:uncharacterized protein HemX
MEKKTMKKVLIGVMVVVVVGFAAVVWAADETQATDAQKAARPATRPTMPMRDQMRGAGGGPNMQGPAGMQGFETLMKQRQEEHAKAVGELEDIKKIAQSENATKTVEALQKMIDKKNEAFKKSVDENEKRQKDRMEMIQKRQAEMDARKAATPPAQPAEKKVEKK